MSSKQAVVNRILTFSCVDGPGNRLVIFFQGCNFQCQACHNPYTMSLCNHCGECIKVCPDNALSMAEDGKVQWHQDLCTECDKCLEACPESASPMTSNYGVADLLEIIRENHPLISGITLSGGEPTVQLPFMIEFLTRLRADPGLNQIHVLLDTNGSLGSEGWNRILPHIDGVMLDLKAWHADRHEWLTGEGNRKVKNSIRLLAAANKLAEVRLLVIPDQSDYREHLDNLCQTLKELPGDTAIRINAFHHHGVNGSAKSWPNATRDQVESFAQQLQTGGIKNLVMPAVYLAEL